MLIHGHNYPFGEYIYYTDCAPLLAAPLHWLVQTVPSLGPYGLYFFDLFILSGLVVSTGLLVLILRRLGLPAWFTVLLAVTLPWLAPQAYRLQVGHMSLSYTPAILFTAWGLQRLYNAWKASRPLGKHFGLLLAGVVAASWLHFYYLPLMSGLVVLFVAVLLIESWRTHRPWQGLVLGTAGLLAGAVALTWGLLQVLDGRYSQRPVGSNGYDWIEWKLQFSSLFTGYIYNKVRFPFERTSGVPYESVSYLTGFVLFGLLAVAVLALLRRLPKEAHLSHQLANENAGFVKYFLLAAIPMAIIALGESIDIDNGNYILYNYLNVFRWLHKLTDRVTQFRALGRFVWPFWWAVLLGFGWYAAQWRRIPGLRWVLPVLCGLLVTDAVNAVQFYHTETQRPNLLAQSGELEPMQQLVGWPKANRYQAILPIPFYHAGTEWQDEPSNFNTDPDDPHCNRTYQLSMVTGLPLMSQKATRSISSQAEQLYSMFKLGGPDPALLALLDQRPILVFVDTAYFDGRNNYYRDLLRERPTMKAVYEREPAFIQEQGMRRIRHQGSWSLYEWFPKGTAAAASRL
ncbi:hypothetical protein [Hymenobacter rubidus]|uniref:hypothetical protein n=1 Tax=Hymenobacter rubidus TaxID=1441626 RepID=UPI00191D557F|nr:hypothetical protein [Hymenobacter rubidus]